MEREKRGGGGETPSTERRRRQGVKRAVLKMRHKKVRRESNSEWSLVSNLFLTCIRTPPTPSSHGDVLMLQSSHNSKQL